jgi:hypothetical protein
MTAQRHTNVGKLTSLCSVTFPTFTTKVFFSKEDISILGNRGSFLFWLNKITKMLDFLKGGVKNE